MHYPHRPPPQPGYLMQKIIVFEKRVIPEHCAELCLSDCSLTAIRSICAAGAAAAGVCAGQLQLSIPVSVCACDACGRCCTLHETISVQTALPSGCLHHPEDARTTLLVLPCVRLLRWDCTGSGCFRVHVHILLEIYLLRYETLGCTPCKPACPSLPLYPPPIC